MLDIKIDIWPPLIQLLSLHLVLGHLNLRNRFFSLLLLFSVRPKEPLFKYYFSLNSPSFRSPLSCTLRPAGDSTADWLFFLLLLWISFLLAYCFFSLLLFNVQLPASISRSSYKSCEREVQFTFVLFTQVFAICWDVSLWFSSSMYMMMRRCCCCVILAAGCFLFDMIQRRQLFDIGTWSR